VQRTQSLALGVWLASRGTIVATGFVLAAVGAVGGVAAAVAWHGSASGARVPTWTAQIVAWAAGVMVAFGGALHAVRRDQNEGVLALVRARGVAAATYLQGRIGGLGVVVAGAVAAPTLAAGVAATSLGRPGPAALATLGALLYALAFGATMAPVALATLGARTRAGGYLGLVAVLAVPELASPWTSQLLPRGWTELTSIPAALAAIGDVFSSRAAALHSARAVAGLVAVIAAALVVVAARFRPVDEKGAA
jgi:hypothetical protein